LHWALLVEKTERTNERRTVRVGVSLPAKQPLPLRLLPLLLQLRAPLRILTGAASATVRCPTPSSATAAEHASRHRSPGSHTATTRTRFYSIFLSARRWYLLGSVGRSVAIWML